MVRKLYNRRAGKRMKPTTARTRIVIAGGGLRGGLASSGGDHRLAMAFAVGALAGDRPSEVAGMEAAAVSFPDFVGTLRSLGAAIEVIG